MAQYDFSALFERYPAIIAGMPAAFSSHEFVLRLAREEQSLYVEALYHYRNTMHRGMPTPFMYVHAFLARHLRTLPDLVEYTGDVPSRDIFGQSSECAQWRKVQ